LISKRSNPRRRQIDRRRADLPQRANRHLLQRAERAALRVCGFSDAADILGDALQHTAGGVNCAQFDDDIAHRRFR
jgi:hypothetical protein